MENKVLATFFGDEKFPVEWESEEEKELHWFYDDLHCPHPISPLYADIGGWWGDTCEYMYRRFGAPFGKGWIGKVVNGYVYTAVVPRNDETEIARLGKYYGQVMSIYAENFLDWWKERYLPEIKNNCKYLDEFSYEKASIPELLIHMEDALDIQERHFKIHWILNLAQFQAFMEFRQVYEEVLGEVDEDNIGKILVSIDDRNWDSLKMLWEMKELVIKSDRLSKIFKEEPLKVLAMLDSEKDREFIEKLESFKQEFGNKAIYTHEYIFPTWREDPTHIIENIQGYIETDYNFYEAYNSCKEEMNKAIEKMFSKVKDEKSKEKLEKALNLALKMAPLTPDHHFYIDQGTYARMRMVFKEIGKALTKAGTLEDPEDIFMLKYGEIRAIAVDPQDFDVKSLVKERRQSMEDAKKITPREWIGTVSEWSLYQEPYKSLWGWPEKFESTKEAAATQEEEFVKVLKGLPASPGVVEGTARFVTSPAEFNKIQKGDILICKMTNPAWVVSFTKISGLVTDTGGALSHPAVVSREFGLPCVVGTSKATRVIKSGMKVRVDGNKGMVEILD
ncbi:MAG: PEP-utilizing enzyme mobile region [Clostridiales bacterium]|jgi:pyruvate,water dikinase|nr:PEP-utilizing enzyme mobile region [Clostridiales bacterium]